MEMVKDIIKNTKSNIKQNKIKNLNDIYDCKNEVVGFSKK